MSVLKLVVTAAVVAVMAILVPRTVSAQTWEMLDGGATAIGVGANGAVWVVGRNPVQGGFDVWRRTGSSWTSVPGSAVRIAVEPAGNAWIIDSSKRISRFDGTKWVILSGAANDIGIGANGQVWVIGDNVAPGGFDIWRWNGSDWASVPGGGVRIAVAPDGNAWMIDDTNNVHRFNGSAFVQVAGSGTDIGVGGDGSVFVIGADGGIQKWNGSTWVKQTGGGSQIAVGPDGSPWIVNAGGEIWRARQAPGAGTVVVRQIFPRGQAAEVQMLQALSYGAFANQVYIGGQVPAASSLPVLDQAFAELGLQAAEVHFAADAQITAAQALGQIRNDAQVRASVNAFAALLLLNKVTSAERDAQTAALRTWSTELFRSARITSAKAVLDEYAAWKADRCGYEGKPARECTVLLANMLGEPSPPQELLAKNAVGAALGSNADQIAAGTAVALTAATTAASFAALTSVLGTVGAHAVGTSMIGGVTTSLFTSFGGAAAAGAGAAGGANVAVSGALGAAGWAGVVAAPVAAAVMVVVVGTIEGFRVVEAARVEPMMKLKLGAAMTEPIVLANALADENAGLMFYLAFQDAAHNNYRIRPSTVNGEVRFYSQGGYVSRFALSYTDRDGRGQFFRTRDLPVGHEETFVIPAGATRVATSGEWLDGVAGWKVLFVENLPGPTYIGYTSYGTIFSPGWKDEYPEISNIIANPNELTVTHGGGYLANIRVTYQQGGRTVTVVEANGAAAGWREVLTIPADASNIRLEAMSLTGLVWEPVKTIVDRTYPAPPNECIKLFGTTLDPKTNNECR